MSKIPTGNISADPESTESQFIEMFGDPEDNPRKWCKLPLKDSVVRIENGKSPVCENFSRVGTNPAVLKLSSISSGYFKATENKALQDGVPFLSAYEVHAGDLLISRKNTLDLVGKACYVFETPEFLQLPDLIFRLDLTHRIHGIFLCFLFNHPSFRPKIQALAGGSAGSMPNISKSRLENLIILVPPIELQNEFAAFIEQLDKSKVANYALRAIS